jgi:Zn-dependent protease with chaperone function/uncharacterized tellurite resistance protein B-like protein
LSFFEEQDRARRASARFVLLYALAVAAIVAATNALCALLYQLWFGTSADWRLYAGASAATLAIIAAGSLEIVARLSIGEAELATLLMGRRVPRGAGLEGERRLINVVDEIALASGLAAPPVYVLTRERSINAFAAGRSPNQAIVVVTQGALDQLSRDELQAVVAHEFSHIINGDIRLNLRAACVLQGIVFLSAIGRFMMRYYSGYGTEEGRRFFHLPFAALGAGLFAIGAIGLLLARWIQGAISREREYLADAAAVQYTRNADALCGALARIATHSQGLRLLNWHGDAMAHMLFAAASHPPIESRMQRVNPHLPPEHFYERARNPALPEKKRVVAEQHKPQTIVPRKATAVAALVASLGEPTPESLEHAAGLLAYLPAPLREALSAPGGAQAAMLACLLDAEATARSAELGALSEVGGDTLARKAEVLAPLIASLDRAYRLPLVALALPVLRKEIDDAARAQFLAAVRAVIQADSRVTLSEFVLETILEAHLGPAAKRAGKVRYQARGEVAAECALVLSLLAQAGGDAATAFAKGAQALALSGLVLTPRDALRLDGVSGALARLRELAPPEKAALVAACAEVSMADGEVKLAEHELLRAVCSALDCPMPPAMAALDARLLRK